MWEWEEAEEPPKDPREQIIALAERLARKEGFAPSWITYPKWAGVSPELRPMLDKADTFKTWAKAILEKKLPPPAWLAEEDPEFRDPELNKPSTNPNNLPAAKRRRLAHTRFACRIALETPLPSSKPLPRPKRPPTRDEIIDLAMRLDSPHMSERHFPRFIYSYPKWASYPPQYEPALEWVAELKRKAERILNGEERPPPWLVKQEPHRWLPKQEVKTAPAPTLCAEASAYLTRRACPLIAAWMLRAASPSPPPLARPPPQRRMPAVWRHPRGVHGDARPTLPPTWEQESRCVTEAHPFDN